MPLVRIIIPRFGEGWKVGEIVGMDEEATRVPLEKGEVELVPDFLHHESEAKKNGLQCQICGKVCKNKLGLNSHKRSHSKS